MGSKTKNSNNQVVVGKKMVKEIEERLTELENSLFHSVLRMEATVASVLENNLITLEQLHGHITTLLEQTRAKSMEALENRNKKVAKHLAEESEGGDDVAMTMVDTAVEPPEVEDTIQPNPPEGEVI